MLISFSGPDGAGKTTQIKLLLDYLKKMNYTVASVHDIAEPHFDYIIGSDFSKYLTYFEDYDVIHSRFRLNSEMNARIMNLVEFIDVGNDWLASFSAYTAFYDAYQWHLHVNQPLLAKNKIVIADKYFYDDIAFKTAYGADYSWLKRLHRDTQIPNISLYFKVDYETILEHNKNRKDLKNILYRNPQNTRKLLNCFEDLTRDYPLHIIDARGTIDETYEKMMKYLLSQNSFSSIFENG